MKFFNILVVKETRAHEARVSLVPTDVEKLIKLGHKVFVEHNAGQLAGFSDIDYETVGATIRKISNNSNDVLAEHKKLFKDINLIIRAKRPNHEREKLECVSIEPNTIMIGALDPFEKNSNHIQEYHLAKITPYSIDKLNLPLNSPMNILASMSKIAGQLSIQDAIKKFGSKAKKAVIIGYGIVGHAALKEALANKLTTTVIVSDSKKIDEIHAIGAKTILINRHEKLPLQQSIVKLAVIDADIVIAAARSSGQAAPLLIPIDTLSKMHSGSVIVDMSISEGGNVEGSEHDKTLTLGNNIIVTNTSGYPKAVPHEASILWSKASLSFINLLAEDISNPQLNEGLC